MDPDKTTTTIGVITGVLTAINGLLNYFGFESIDVNLAGLLTSAGLVGLGYYANKKNRKAIAG